MEFLKYLQTMQQTTQIRFGFINDSDRFSDVFGTKATIRFSKRLRCSMSPGIYMLAPNSRIRGALLISPKSRGMRLLAWQNVRFCTRQYLCDTSSAVWFGMFHEWPIIHNSTTDELPLPEIVLETHNSYLYEQRLLEAVKNGDFQTYYYYFCRLTGSADFGRVANGRLRNRKNLLICAVTLLTRQAIKGGVVPNEAFALSDFFCQQIESKDDARSLNAIVQALGHSFIKLIQKYKRERTAKLSPLAQKIEMNLRQHCGEKRTLDDLARELKRDKYYLAIFISAKRAKRLLSMRITIGSAALNQC